jgi:hypothetical protein
MWKGETRGPATVTSSAARAAEAPGSEVEPGAAVDRGRNAGGGAFAHGGCWMDPDEAEAEERRWDPPW